MPRSSEMHTKHSVPHWESKCASQIWVRWFTDNRSASGHQSTGQDSTLPGACQVWVLLEEAGAAGGTCSGLQAPPQHHLHHTPGLEGLIWSQIFSNEDRTLFRSAFTKAHMTSLEPAPCPGWVCLFWHPAPTQLPHTKIHCPLPTSTYFKCFTLLAVLNSSNFKKDFFFKKKILSLLKRRKKKKCFIRK